MDTNTENEVDPSDVTGTVEGTIHYGGLHLWTVSYRDDDENTYQILTQEKSMKEALAKAEESLSDDEPDEISYMGDIDA